MAIKKDMNFLAENAAQPRLHLTSLRSEGTRRDLPAMCWVAMVLSLRRSAGEPNVIPPVRGEDCFLWYIPRCVNGGRRAQSTLSIEHSRKPKGWHGVSPAASSEASGI